MDRPRDKAVRGPREREQELEQRDRATDHDTSSGSSNDASSRGPSDTAQPGPREEDDQ